MAKFLVTGANGQVGHCLVKQLQAKGADVLGVDRDKLDITDKTAVENCFKFYQPDVVINAAAHTAVDRAESEVALSEAINVQGPQYLAEAACKQGAIILHISTDYVFDGEGTHAYKESDVTAPQGVYGRTKLAGEQAVLAANPKAIVLRTAWVFGEHGNNFVKTMLRLGKERDTLGVVSDQFGGPTYAGDIAAALIEIAEQLLRGNSAYGVYHFTGYPYVSWYEFAEAIFAQAEKANILEKRPRVNPIKTSDYPTPAKRPANSRLDLSKIYATFKILPSDWQSALSYINIR